MNSAKILYIALILAISGCDSIQPERPLASIPMGPGTLEVRYLEIMGPGAFAPHIVRFYYREQDGEQFLAETQLHNDGAEPGDHNLEVVDQGNGRYQFVIKGQEQAHERWLVETSGGKVRMEKLAPSP